MTIVQTYRCSICGHIYDEKNGDVEAPPGTAFWDLLEDRRCPVCLAEMSRFSPFAPPLARPGI